MSNLFKTEANGPILTVEIKGVGVISINRTDEGVIIDSYDLSQENNINTMANTDEEFSEAYVNEVEALVKALFPTMSVEPEHEDIHNQYTLGKRPLEAAAILGQDEAISLEKLTPIGGQCDPFHDEVKKLTRPYFPITPEQYQSLMAGKSDYYKVNNQIFTFGTADGGYALMPLGTQANQKLLF